LDQALGGGWTSAIHPADVARPLGDWRAILASGKPGEAEARLRRFDWEFRWFLFRAAPLRNEAGGIIKRIIKDSRRAREAIRRVRALSHKTDVEKVPLDINSVVNEDVALVQRELFRHRVPLHMDLSPALPMVLADRVQLQQVIINLVMNGVEAMQLVADRPRELVLESRQDDAHHVLAAVKDCGVGIAAANADCLFTAFFTTKSGPADPRRNQIVRLRAHEAT
jgi:signal transduction histidine kinase